jgi:16S rRNA (cytosine967-C5)-methyltransferase
MTPAARIQAVIDILGELEKTNQPVDRHLRDWGRAHRFAGSKDRAAIGERIYAIQRRRAWLTWRMGTDAPRALVIGSMLDEGDMEHLFSGGSYGPPVLTDAERVVIGAPPPGEPPPHVRGEYPEFLESELRRAFGDKLPEEMAALQLRAPADLRVNTLKTTRDDVLIALRDEGYDANETPVSPFGIRIASGEAKLGRSALFESGAFEFQDEAAQIAALLCDAAPEMRVLDLAAGAGGKSLALAAIMRNEGEIVATDIRFDALVELERRAARAGAAIIRTAKELQGAFDVVLVDAPCSGTGTWRRQPELRWRLTRQRITDVMTTQDMLLTQAAAHVKPGGRLVYATCSILPCENEDRIAAFRKTHADFAVVPVSDVWRATVSPALPPRLEQFFRASPLATRTDGFFAAVLQKRRS